MAYELSAVLLLGAGNTGLTLTANLFDDANGAAAGLTTTTMTEIAASSGAYLWTGTLPEGHRGHIRFNSAGTFKTSVSINPEEVETPTSDAIAADVWSYVSRTLTMSAAQIAAILSGTTLTLERGDTWVISITGLGSLVGRSKLWFTLKGQHSHTDAQKPDSDRGDRRAIVPQRLGGSDRGRRQHRRDGRRDGRPDDYRQAGRHSGSVARYPALLGHTDVDRGGGHDADGGKREPIAGCHEECELMAYMDRPEGTVSLVVLATATVSSTVHIGNPAEVGLKVPTLTTPTTVTVKVGLLADGSDAVGIVDQAGTAKLVLASGAGGVAIGSLDLGQILGYPYLTVVLGAAQAGDVTFTLTRKSISTS